MLTADGPKVVEWNVRFGDPEAQALLPLFESDPYELLADVAAGEITTQPRFSDQTALTVVLATQVYPASLRSGEDVHWQLARHSTCGSHGMIRRRKSRG